MSRKEYWSIRLDSHKGRTKFSARLTHYQGNKLDQFDIPDDAAQAAILAALNGSRRKSASVEKKSRSPAAPFTTSTLQQGGRAQTGHDHRPRHARRPAAVQKGVDVGSGGTIGLITLPMRTDSVALANEAVTEIRHYIDKHFDADYLPKAPVTFKNKAKTPKKRTKPSRSTSIYRTPGALKPFLTAEQFGCTT